MHEDLEKAEATFHSTARQAALLAQKASAGRLVIGHFSARYRDLAPLLEEAKSIFPATELAIEGETITLREENEPTGKDEPKDMED
ncbi:MAG: hypothetical protein HC913_18570 [Microscillaceae bacterium]|nr:hypothetical protein [Microscillaceae bacterium]